MQKHLITHCSLIMGTQKDSNVVFTIFLFPDRQLEIEAQLARIRLGKKAKYPWKKK